MNRIYLISYNMFMLQMINDTIITYFKVDMDRNELNSISRNLYKATIGFIGNKQEVHIRRTATNLRDDVLRMESQVTDSSFISCFIGSKAEGFRFESSGHDWLFIYSPFRVIPSDSYMSLYESNTRLLVMENEMTKPGFALIRLRENSTDFHAPSCIVSMLNGRYVSSKKWKETHSEIHAHTVSNHGPCTQWKLGGRKIEYTFCLKCDTWPVNAKSSIQRLRQNSWPSSDIIQSIENDGVVFVPIGAKESFFEDTEWRMSFSLAEKKLIHSMNHTQFLCYGLLKLFFKEAIDADKEVKGLMCPYVMKTVLLWEITNSQTSWNPSSLLPCFWKCFCRLLQWVRCSYCPNFFVPDDNLFEGRIEGANREKLLHYLRTLHHEGYKCLARSSSLASFHISDVLNGTRSINVQRVDCRTCVAKTIIDEELTSFPRNAFCFRLNTNVVSLQLHYLMETAYSNIEKMIAKNWLHRSLSELCMSQLMLGAASGRSNKIHYKNHVQRMRVLSRCRTDSASHFLHQAMECYKSGNDCLTLKLARKARKTIFSQGALSRSDFNHEKLQMLGAEDLPIETIMKKYFVDSLHHDKNISELYIEMEFFHHNGTVSPAICVLASAVFVQQQTGKSAST